ncbi:tyrosine-type recombinase/integrase [Elizabethkingia anophelis]|uniref:tyrosine-type recombinase/integrase n=1 Tax=Elizabethkingia anophelis TaxID=1117645 RepID=UPI001371B09A|nr:tyrosine-type recombinase/integrase [Elizabethkingia anophelis]MYY29520.1 nicotinate-nucleotide pyrophosphorylase [Elizabethkingia anophelis]HAY3506928.1 tyrosine-type recombinase/integrase [Elizabethkingia anophelis]
MDKKFIYTSKLAPYINGFLKEKELKGYKSSVIKWVLLEFDKFYNEYNIQDNFIKEETIDKWRSTRTNDSSRSLYIKYSAWIQLGNYIRDLGIECYIPIPYRKGAKNNYLPYIFTHEEIQTIFLLSNSLQIRYQYGQTMIFIMPAMLRLLYSTGLRIGEALAIKNKDIDFNKRTIVINDSKTNTQRIVAINDSLLSVLQQYKEFRDKNPIKKNLLLEAPFFITQRGNRCQGESVRIWFSDILNRAGISKKLGGNPPRLHDLRHTAAVHSLAKMVRNGIDIYCALPMISFFLGHRDTRSTNNYVRLTKEMFPEIIKLEYASALIFPKIQKKNES